MMRIASRENVSRSSVGFGSAFDTTGVEGHTYLGSWDCAARTSLFYHERRELETIVVTA